MARKLILEFHQPETGSFDMGFSPAHGHRIYQDGERFFMESRTEGGSDFVTRIDESTFFHDRESINNGWEVSKQIVERELEEAKKDQRYTVRSRLS